MKNEEMKAGRFLRWHKARCKIAAIKKHLEANGQVVIGTSTHVTCYKQKHAEMFRAIKSGAYVQRGKRWDCIDFCGIRFC